MGWHNPPVPWRELERRLSGRRAPGRPPGADGNDSPAWGHHRQPFQTDVRRVETGTPWWELHVHSNFSFLDGASHPEDLAVEAARLGLEGLALTDHDGLYGVVRFAEAARGVGLRTVFGAELSLELTQPQTGRPDSEGHHLLVLAPDAKSYRRLCRVISEAQLRGGEKGKPVYGSLAEVAAHGKERWVVLTGCRKGLVPAALAAGGPGAAAAALDELVGLFGRKRVYVELTDRGDPADSARNDVLYGLALDAGLRAVATGNVHHATPAQGRLAAALAAVRARRGLDEMDGWLPAAGGAYLRSGEEMAARFARYPGVLDTTVGLGRECAFDLQEVAPALPRFPVPDGHTEMTWLRHLTERGARRKYRDDPKGHRQIEHELAVISEQGFPGYFLIVDDIMRFCRDNDILAQGRGSAANSAVCYALGITAVDAVAHKLLFERFLSVARDGPPDIDIDIESGRREEVIQYVYGKYGRDRAAQVANVISYRPKLAVRDMARALGYSPGQVDAWSKQIDNRDGLYAKDDHDVPEPVLELARQVLRYPRHLGIHSGGMVLCDRPVNSVCPVEWARMPGRTVLQWDKDDCAAMNLVKFDLLGLGMLEALHGMFDLIRDHYGRYLSIDEIMRRGDDEKVYDMLCAADAVGVFQVESRAQLATLPRLRPRKFYDLVVEVALIRPGPIQGGSVHPYIRRHNGEEEVTYPHDLLKPALEKTKGVPLFQEQLMQIAIDAAGFSATEADQLRQALSSKRSAERLEKLRPRLLEGMAGKGIPVNVAEDIFGKLIAFADYGFPESHAISFAMLAYVSAWLKCYYPAVFTTALLNAQPMGFYSPQSLVADTRRHGVEVRGPDLNASGAKAGLEPAAGGSGEWAVRMGLSSVRRVGDDLAERISAGRPYADLPDLVRRQKLTAPVLEALATAGAFGCFGMDRRPALWAAGAAATIRAEQLPVDLPGLVAPPLPEMTDQERAVADLWATGVTPDAYPTQFLRDQLTALGVLTAADLKHHRVPDRARVLAAGVVTHRQRPPTAGGVVFVNLEDETGHVNVICPPGVFAAQRRAARDAPALLVQGTVEKHSGVTNLLAERLTPLPITTAGRSRDFK